MKATVIVLGTDELDIARTVDSIHQADVSMEVQIIVRAQEDTTPWSDATDGLVILMRAGDRMCEQGLTTLSRGLSNADVVLGSFRIAGNRHWDIDVRAPKIDSLEGLAKWAVAPPFELSAIAIRRKILPASVHPAPCFPGGELALLHAVLASKSNATIMSTDDVVAEVRIRPVHSGDTAAMLEQLRGVLAGPLGEDPIHASRVRRRALSLAFLESGPPVPGQFDADSWWGPALADATEDGALAILRDLHWVLSCLAEVRRMTELGLAGLAEAELSDAKAELPPDFAGLLATNESLHVLVGELTDTISWLHDEVRVRDEQVAWLHAEVRQRDEQIATYRSGA